MTERSITLDRKQIKTVEKSALSLLKRLKVSNGNTPAVTLTAHPKTNYWF